MVRLIDRAFITSEVILNLRLRLARLCNDANGNEPAPRSGAVASTSSDRVHAVIFSCESLAYCP